MSGPRAILIGLPGAGKSEVGKRLARRLGVDFLDSDDLVEQAAGLTIPQIFSHRGEEAFREIEHTEIMRALDTHDGVLSLGGGAVLHPGTRAALAGRPVVYLHVDAHAASTRVRGDGSRPLLTGDPTVKLAELRAQRAPLYTEIAAITVDTSRRNPRQVTVEVGARLPRRVEVGRPGSAGYYEVTIGPDLAGAAAHAVAEASAVLVVHAPAVATLAQRIAAEAGASGVRVALHEMPDAEDAKSLEALAALWDRLGAERIGRDGAVIAVGGGATTDAAGFAAATWLRGITLVNVPTTVLGMVDAAVGGKTGINTPHGKNLAGAFHTPAAVICDLDTLATLPWEDLRAGLAEVIKCGFIADPEILELLEKAPGGPVSATEPASGLLADLVERAVAVKARVVGEDLTERTGGTREFLNYGHTFAHAIEKVENYRWRHGEAVSVGMVFAAELARATGLLAEDLAGRHRAVLEALGLPTGYAGPATKEELLAAMAADKKVRAGVLRFVLLDDLARPRTVTGPAPEHLDAAFAAVLPTERSAP
ncbi:3-dehydroquinate synthase [Bogoriella caseilytica]|uniref:Multifunctional fusion protein n=1 Tax=Bogoriella caseilytica TaxID=56055 RepID=A0A3N2B9C7_9MICO|nr:3-dehydroquinate synthase [Bogoriella caseilytica]ROR71704.1 3-dehydroquinate synthase [Bogoriella caseilytica]